MALAVAGVALPGRGLAASVYTVGNYPVEARASDAVTAKNNAIADGQAAALRSLIKRLVPVGAYSRVSKLQLGDASRLLEGIRVRSERNSSTEYIASLDFLFSATAIKALLDREGLPYTETQAPTITIVPVWRAGEPGAAGPLGGTQAAQQWREAWKGLDLENSIAPFKLETLKATVHADTIKALAAGDASLLRTFASEYRDETLLLAIGEPDAAGKKLAVTLIGQDGIGGMNWRRAYRIDTMEPGYSIELAAVVSHRVLEGRWKMSQIRGGGMQAARAGTGAAGAIEFAVEFRGMGEWADISRRLSQTPGVEDLDVAGLSQRGARVTLRYSGGVDQLADVLTERGLALREAGSGWVLSAQ